MWKKGCPIMIPNGTQYSGWTIVGRERNEWRRRRRPGQHCAFDCNKVGRFIPTLTPTHPYNSLPCPNSPSQIHAGAHISYPQSRLDSNQDDNHDDGVN